MERKPGINPVKGGVSIVVEGSRQAHDGEIFSSNFNPMPVVFKGDEIYSRPFSVFHDNGINYHYLSVQLIFSNTFTEYSAAKILFEIGNSDFTIYEMIFRLMFSFSLFFFLSILVFRLKISQFKTWNIEQKLTSGLMLVSALYGNPLFGLRLANWLTSCLLDSLFTGLTIGYSFYFLFVLFDSLKYKSRELDKLFFFPKILLSFLIGLIVSIRSSVYVLYNILEFSNSRFKIYYNIADRLLFPFISIAIIYLGILMFSTFRTIDETEKYKLILYNLSFFLCILSGLVGYMVRDGNALLFTVKYSILFVFTILMAYFHWPFDPKRDIEYEDQNESQTNTGGETFLLPEDLTH